ncbi:hypothetical protein NQ318_023250 [Aromia moschata]|uniref:Reverse transcriptase domain-containing protein n=1 Tax=Aromia moschata TaxID=1265417 RepID=A0AAV8XMW3_9CUCU|nr:hypothetical protein NQ318_023250 [Aromia moschata]
MASAPFLAVRCLQQLAFEYRDEFPNLSTIIENDFYVDDLITGSDTIDDALFICEKITCILRSGGFSLRKFRSNNPTIVEHIANSDETNSILEFSDAVVFISRLKTFS